MVNPFWWRSIYQIQVKIDLRHSVVENSSLLPLWTFHLMKNYLNCTNYLIWIKRTWHLFLPCWIWYKQFRFCPSTTWSVENHALVCSIETFPRTRSTVIMTRNKFITKWNLAHILMMVLKVISRKSAKIHRWEFCYQIFELWRKFAWKIAILATRNYGKRCIVYFQIFQLF